MINYPMAEKSRAKNVCDTIIIQNLLMSVYTGKIGQVVEPIRARLNFFFTKRIRTL